MRKILGIPNPLLLYLYGSFRIRILISTRKKLPWFLAFFYSIVTSKCYCIFEDLLGLVLVWGKIRIWNDLESRIRTKLLWIHHTCACSVCLDLNRKIWKIKLLKFLPHVVDELHSDAGKYNPQGWVLTFAPVHSLFETGVPELAGFRLLPDSRTHFWISVRIWI
jgi:hypothetical protein